MSDKVEVKKEPKLTALRAQKDPEYKCVEPEEWYTAVFDKAETGQGNFGPYVKFSFTLRNGSFEDTTSAKGHKVNRLMDATLSPSKPLWKWIKVMIGKEPEIDKEYDVSAFYGEKFRVLIKDKEKRKGSKDDRRFQVVDTIKRLKKEE